MLARASSMVTGKVLAISVATLIPVLIETPSSARKTSINHLKYRMGSGRSKPSLARSASISSMVGSSPKKVVSMSSTGSPGTKLSNKNVTTVTRINVGIVSSTRLST